MLPFMPVGITAYHYSLVKIDQFPDIVPVMMSIGFKFLVPIEQDKVDPVVAYFNDGLDHPWQGLVTLCRQLATNTHPLTWSAHPVLLSRFKSSGR